LSASIIREAQAKDLIAGIEDPSIRVPIGLIVDSLVEFYRADPTQLRGFFDVVFFVHVLEEQIDDVSGLLRGTVSRNYMGYPPEPMPVDEASDSGPSGVRLRQAYNYAANLDDEFVQAALLGMTNRAGLKQTLLLPNVRIAKEYIAADSTPPVPEAPAEPFDFLFMVMAVDHALKPLQPARTFFENS
jgi:hypothetical protein